jgi:hypothetical protein
MSDEVRPPPEHENETDHYLAHGNIPDPIVATWTGSAWIIGGREYAPLPLNAVGWKYIGPSKWEQSIPREVAEQALDAFFELPWTTLEIGRMQRALAAVRPLLLPDAEREIAALKAEMKTYRERVVDATTTFNRENDGLRAEIARLRDEHREIAEQFAMYAGENWKKAMRHDPADANYRSSMDKAEVNKNHAARCEALAEGKE